MKWDVPYAAPSGRVVHLDLYRPEHVDGSLPCVLWLGGGGWQRMNKRGAVRWAAWLTGHGFAVAGVNYRLAPEHPWPHPLGDVRAAVRYLVEHADELGLDPRRLAVMGDSAGGHLASLLAVTPREASAALDADHLEAARPVTSPPPLPRLGRLVGLVGVVAVCPPTDLRTPHMASLQEVHALLGDAGPEAASTASPIHHLDAKSPPHLLIHGDADGLVPPSQSIHYAAALDAVGVDVRTLLLSQVGHDSATLYSDATARGLILDSLLRWTKLPATEPRT